jgi:hypothetical protein
MGDELYIRPLFVSELGRYLSAGGTIVGILLAKRSVECLVSRNVLVTAVIWRIFSINCTHIMADCTRRYVDLKIPVDCLVQGAP